MSRVLASVVLVALVGVVTAGEGSLRSLQGENCYVTISKDPDLRSMFAMIALASGQRETLETAPDLTVFAPINEAFADAPPTLSQQARDPANAELLSTLLQYHTMESEVASAEAIEGDLATPAGLDIPVTSGDDGPVLGIEPFQARIVGEPVKASNCVIYKIDNVLIPEAIYDTVDPKDRPIFTKNGCLCKFEFELNGEKLTKCTTVGNPEPWCKTQRGCGEEYGGYSWDVCDCNEDGSGEGRPNAC
ncbi:unnamed protein product [Vitrella brassicaformis CCMP3155]|uniref:FAS1 domain-containing protein n=2 Tax=Vitrella brassicaformis TaxID=1169539 RepID=A0A0G4FUK0_VITBC|nr:unnamed protein product [Vitrella brassicaformis CCMP3155]|eukprot:CEM18278.1 unnamed protein product [Vitrella brassicaformis CCMP3155]